MPLYEYLCSTCGHRFEVRQGIKEQALTDCPDCAGSIRSVVHPVGIVFKGSGFYKTDSRGASATNASAAERKSEETPAPAGETAPSTPTPSTGSESKPAAAPAGDAKAGAAAVS